MTGGPAPFAKADRSRFLQALDEALARLSRRPRNPAERSLEPDRLPARS